VIAKKEKTLIGWRELISFPEWGVKDIRAKTDTGAKSSAIDVASIEELGHNRVEFDVIIHNKHRDRHKRVQCKISRRSRVRSSNGKVEERLFVMTTLRIGEVEKEVEVGLVCRKNMLCRALIGRSTLQGTFIIDPEKKYLQSKKKKLKKAVKQLTGQTANSARSTTTTTAATSITQAKSAK
jgi:hypothetical protein